MTNPYLFPIYSLYSIFSIPYSYSDSYSYSRYSFDYSLFAYLLPRQMTR